MKLHVELNATGATVYTENGKEFGFRRDGKGGIECSSRPRTLRGISATELAQILKAAENALYNTAGA